MAFNVRLAAYKGMAQVPQLNPRQFTGDAVFLFDEPAVWVQTLSVSSIAATSVVPAGDNSTVRILHVEVPNVQAVRYRIIPGSYPIVPADTDALSISGRQNFVFAAGWRISLIDAAGLP